ncbi:hypothetical protein BCV70DRAFT_197528 [Testicularia cyperi]|uniref:Uncharacterized protein n=1 Tax=Testicularia cyperi TaxID=1882483 RepID=A0A317XZS4_9BASI|nr:hypothetical protein BCV70DRAFT_197528 [Testicularia cyperi]
MAQPVAHIGQEASGRVFGLAATGQRLASTHRASTDQSQSSHQQRHAVGGHEPPGYGHSPRNVPTLKPTSNMSTSVLAPSSVPMSRELHFGQSSAHRLLPQQQPPGGMGPPVSTSTATSHQPQVQQQRRLSLDRPTSREQRYPERPSAQHRGTDQRLVERRYETRLSVQQQQQEQLRAQQQQHEQHLQQQHQQQHQHQHQRQSHMSEPKQQEPGRLVATKTSLDPAASHRTSAVQSFHHLSDPLSQQSGNRATANQQYVHSSELARGLERRQASTQQAQASPLHQQEPRPQSRQFLDPNRFASAHVSSPTRRETLSSEHVRWESPRESPRLASSAHHDHHHLPHQHHQVERAPLSYSGVATTDRHRALAFAPARAGANGAQEDQTSGRQNHLVSRADTTRPDSLLCRQFTQYEPGQSPLSHHSRPSRSTSSSPQHASPASFQQASLQSSHRNGTFYQQPSSDHRDGRVGSGSQAMGSSNPTSVRYRTVTQPGRGDSSTWQAASSHVINTHNTDVAARQPSSSQPDGFSQAARPAPSSHPQVSSDLSGYPRLPQRSNEHFSFARDKSPQRRLSLSSSSIITNQRLSNRNQQAETHSLTSHRVLPPHPQNQRYRDSGSDEQIGSQEKVIDPPRGTLDGEVGPTRQDRGAVSLLHTEDLSTVPKDSNLSGQSRYQRSPPTVPLTVATDAPNAPVDPNALDWRRSPRTARDSGLYSDATLSSDEDGAKRLRTAVDANARRRSLRPDMQLRPTDAVRSTFDEGRKAPVDYTARQVDRDLFPTPSDSTLSRLQEEGAAKKSAASSAVHMPERSRSVPLPEPDSPRPHLSPTLSGDEHRIGRLHVDLYQKSPSRTGQEREGDDGDVLMRDLDQHDQAESREPYPPLPKSRPSGGASASSMDPASGPIATSNSTLSSPKQHSRTQRVSITTPSSAPAPATASSRPPSRPTLPNSGTTTPAPRLVSTYQVPERPFFWQGQFVAFVQGGKRTVCVFERYLDGDYCRLRVLGSNMLMNRKFWDLGTLQDTRFI